MRFMIAILSMAPIFCLVASPIAAQQSEKSPDQELPPHITRLTIFGERADWSHDGKRLLFLSKTYGDIFEIDLATRTLRLLTGHYPHAGYTRALYLVSVICQPRFQASFSIGEEWISPITAQALP